MDSENYLGISIYLGKCRKRRQNERIVYHLTERSESKSISINIPRAIPVNHFIIMQTMLPLRPPLKQRQNKSPMEKEEESPIPGINSQEVNEISSQKIRVVTYDTEVRDGSHCISQSIVSLM